MASTAQHMGAWRDRTNLYISYRQSYTHHPAKRQRLGPPSNGRFSDTPDGDSENQGLLTNDGDAVIEMDLLPPRWLDIQDEINTHLAEISTKMKRLEQLHAKHVLPGFDDEDVKKREERDISDVTNEITRGFITCQNAVRRIDKLVQQQQSTGSSVTDADQTMARNLKISLASRVGEVSSHFRKKQSAYLKKLRQLDGMSTPLDRASTPLAQNPYTDPAMLDSEADRSSAQRTLLATAQVRRRTGLHDSAIEQREREIESIAQGVIDLSTLFQELNSMVIDQGSLLDRIDYNVERTAEHVKAAEKELVVATGYQKKSTKRKMLLLLVLLVVGMVILLVVKPKRRAVAQPPIEAPRPNDPGTGLPRRSVEWRSTLEAALGGRGTRRQRLSWKHRRRRAEGWI